MDDFEREETLRHPYTRALWRAMPKHGFHYIGGVQPYVKDNLQGCPFAPRCPYARAICAAELPDFVSVGERHQTRCFLQYEDAPADAHNPFKQDKIKE